MTLHLFNPENDLALALGCRNYTPPPRVARLHRAGAFMPVWWAGETDRIVVPEAMEDGTEWLKREYGLCAGIGYDPGVDRLCPWGWSPDAVRQFSLAGVPASLLPSDVEVEAMRQLSHRRISIGILSRCGCDIPLPEETSDPDRVVSLEAVRPGRYVKSPWSCSGRGVFHALGMPHDVLREKASGIIHRQGSVMVETGFDRVMDFAALFNSCGGHVEFVGWSVFLTESRGVYSGNVVAPQWQLVEMLTRYVTHGELVRTLDALTQALSAMIPGVYNGPFGVDMMIFRSDEGMRIHPCVELNLRMTMGFAAMAVNSRLSLSSPYVMGWRWGDVSSSGILLLPPAEGFRLVLSPLELK